MKTHLNNFKPKTVLTALTLVFWSMGADAGMQVLARPDGGISSGGGGAVVCRDANHQVVSAEMYDLFEARNRDGLTIPESDRPASEQLEQVLREIPEGFHRELLRSRVHIVLDAIKFADRKFKLKAPDDLGRDWGILLPVGCDLEGAAYFERYKRSPKDIVIVTVSQGVYEKLSETSKAALILHEAIYWMYRESYLHGDSQAARHLTALGFNPTAEAVAFHEQIESLYLLSPGVQSYQNAYAGFVISDIPKSQRTVEIEITLDHPKEISAYSINCFSSLGAVGAFLDARFKLKDPSDPHVFVAKYTTSAFNADCDKFGVKIDYSQDLSDETIRMKYLIDGKYSFEDSRIYTTKPAVTQDVHTILHGRVMVLTSDVRPFVLP